MRHLLLLIACVVGGNLVPAQDQAEASPAESPLFHAFAHAPHRGEGTVLPDYSYAGYHRSEKPLPTVTRENHRYFNVVDYGARGDDDQSDRDAFLKAVAAAERSPGPAVVYVPPGRYLLNEPGDLGKPGLVLSRKDLVLQGAGMAKTELFFREPCLTQRALLTIAEPTPATLPAGRARDDYTIRGFTLSPIATFPPRGSLALHVVNAGKIRPGMLVTLNATLDFTTEAGQAYFAPHAVPPGAVRMGKTRYLFEVHRVASVDGDLVKFAEPIQYELERYSSGVLYEIRSIDEVGVEDLTLSGNNRELFYHHMGSRTESGYFLLDMRDVTNGWVRNVRFRNYGNALQVARGGFNTFLNLVFDGNAGHLLAGAYAGSYGNLFLHNRELAPTWHGPIGNGGADTVALHSRYFANMEMHCGGSRGTLMDSCTGDLCFLRGGGAKQYPHQGENNCFWNWDNTRPGKVDFWPEGQPYGYMMPPIVVGTHGESCEIADPDTDTIAIESPGAKVAPASLFMAQLALRLGTTPSWLVEEHRRFETISRHTTVAIRSPAPHAQVPAHTPFTVTLDLDPALAHRDIAAIRIQASATALDQGFQLMKELTQAPYTAQITLAPGTWVLTATLINSRGEIVDSRPIPVHADDGRPWTQAQITRSVGYEETGALGAAVQALGLHVDGKMNLLNRLRADHPGLSEPELDRHFSEAVLAAYTAGIPLMTQEHEAGDNPRIAAQLIDGDLESPIGKSVPYKYSALFDLGRETPVSRLDLCFDRDFADVDYKVELMGSNDPRAWTTFLNDEGFWEPALIRNGLSRIAYPVSTHGKRVTLYLPARTYRYLRLVAPAANLKRLTEVAFFGQ